MKIRSMRTKSLLTIVLSTILFVAGFSAGSLWQSGAVANAQNGTRIFELRTYTAPEGKLEALKARFRDHTIRIFNNHNMTSIGYWTPADAPNSQNTLIYVLAHPSREDAKKNWAAFQADPEWKKVAADSQVDGPIVTKVESVFMNPTDFSPFK
jgi:hypothetical protein